MSTKFSIVRSVPMYRDKPSSIRLMGSSNSSNMERKESFMFSNRSSVLRGSSLAAAALAVTALAGLVGPASASNIIYQDSFGGSSTLGTLDGAAPTTGSMGVTWAAPSSNTYGFSDSGYTSASATTTRYATAYLPFTPVTGEVYTLSASFNITGLASASNDYGAWMGLGFMTAVGSGWDSGGASPWEMTTANLGGGGGNTQAWNGTEMVGVVNNTSGSNTLSLVLNTGSNLWSYQGYLTDSAGTSEVGSGTLSPNPSIIDVGLQNSVGQGNISNFSLTVQPVPEPATLGLVAAGSLGVLLLKRRKTV